MVRLSDSNTLSKPLSMLDNDIICQLDTNKNTNKLKNDRSSLGIAIGNVLYQAVTFWILA